VQLNGTGELQKHVEERAPHILTSLMAIMISFITETRAFVLLMAILRILPTDLATISCIGTNSKTTSTLWWRGKARSGVGNSNQFEVGVNPMRCVLV
jgi:hypothetical protein